jgi:hypothetical protein
MAAGFGKLACPGIPLLEMLLHFRRREIRILLRPASEDEHEFGHLGLLAATLHALLAGRSAYGQTGHGRPVAQTFSSRRNESPQTALVVSILPVVCPALARGTNRVRFSVRPFVLEANREPYA